MIREVLTWVTAVLLPPVGGWSRRYGRPTRLTGRVRRWYIGRPAGYSSHEIAHEHAQTLVTALEKAGLRPFLTEAADTTIVFGLHAHERRKALSALQGSLEGAWYLSWRRGGRTATTLLSKARGSAPLGAESWRLFALSRLGRDSALGEDEAAVLTFWVEEPSGWSERIGFRGLHRFQRSDAEITREELDGRSYPGLSVFPVARDMTRFIEPVDIVYTWVDGEDPSWREDFELWRSREPDVSAQSAHPARFRSLDELLYSMRSVFLYAGWFRHLYIVTSGQVPTWLAEHEKVTVVPHSSIIEAEHLPTFNSHAIEARLHRIEGLSEHFVYMNDDVFLGRPLQRLDFFTAGGSLRFVASEALIPSKMSPATISVDQAAMNNRRLVEGAFGRSVRFKLDHAPHPLRRSVAAEIEERFPDEVRATVSHRFRSPDDVSIASGLTQFVAALTGRGEPSAMRNGYMNIESPRLPLFLRVLRLGRGYDSFCLNQTEVEAETLDLDRMARVTAFLADYFGVPAPWEA